MISGKQGSGKTTLGFELKKMSVQMGLDLKVLKFAYPLYEIHAEVERICRKYGMGWKGIDGELLQVLGTEWGRVKNPNMWVDAAVASAKSFKPVPDIVVFDDCRFLNEIDAFDNSDVQQVLKVRLECPDEVRKFRAAKWRANGQHKSETALDDFPFDLTFKTHEVGVGLCAILIMTSLGYNVC